MGERIRLVTGKGKLIGTVKHDARLNCCRYKLKKGAHEIGLSKLSGKEIFIDYEVTLTTAVWCESKEEIQELRNKKNGSPNKAYCDQSVRYRSWCKQDNIKMATCEDHTSFWVHRDVHWSQGIDNNGNDVGRKGRISGATDRYRSWWLDDGHLDHRLGGYAIRKTSTYICKSTSSFKKLN